MQTQSDRLKALPPYLFAEIDRKKKAAVAAMRASSAGETPLSG